MFRRNRMARGALSALALALVVAAPAGAAQPTRTVIDTSADQHYAAGEGCPFSVTVDQAPGSRVTVTNNSDGSTVYEHHEMKRAITNDTNGKVLIDDQIYHDLEWIDPSNGWIRGITSGRSIQQFYPGDVGPYGIQQSPDAYVINGTTWWAWDPATQHQTEFTWTGTLIDICAAIS